MTYPNGMQAVYIQQLRNALIIDQVRSTQINPVPKGNRLPRWQQMRNIAQHAHIVNNRPARGLPIGARMRGLKLPGVLRGLPVFWAFTLGYTLVEWYMRPGNQGWHIPDGWRLDQDCGNGVENMISARTVFCGSSTAYAHRYYSGYSTNFGTWTQFTLGELESWRNPNSGWMNFRGNRSYTYIGDGSPSTDPTLHPRYVDVPAQAVAVPQTLPEPYPGYYPPLMGGAVPAPSVLPGRYKSPKQVMPEWPDAGYDVAPDSNFDFPEPKYLRSQRPGPKERERKVRLKDYAIGRTLEWLVSQATEGLDFQRALFEALPWWRKIALYKAARRLELQYDQGRIVAGRLHYVDLTPDQKMQAIYDYIDEVDVAKAIENVIKMQLTDMFWAEIGNRIGRYQVGPWDEDHRPEPDTTGDWRYYVPDTAPDTTHNHWTYETLVGRRLTRQEAERIHREFDQYRSQPWKG